MTWGVVLSGGAAGVVTAVAFAALHELLNSDIWFSVVPMMFAGALCGGSLAWTYGLLFPAASLATWTSFVGLQIALLLLLGASSVVMFDPVTPMAVLIAANEPPSELIAQATWLRSCRRLERSSLSSSAADSLPHRPTVLQCLPTNQGAAPSRCSCGRIAFSKESGYATPDLIRFAPTAEQQIR